MVRVKQFFSDLFAIFFMGVGVSTTRTKRKKFDLRRLVSNVCQQYPNCAQARSGR